MREIKFRAWNERLRRMISWEEICDGVFTFNDLKFDFVKWIQFTGLKDKNGKEIYEGDILTYGYKKDGIILQIIWNDLSDNGFEILRQKNKHCVHDIRIYRFDERAEVIGNKFENKELLK